MSRITQSIIVLILTALPTTAFTQLGPPSGMIYANDELFRTIGTPTELPDRGKFDTIYALGGDLANVSETAPGEPGFNGGRWEVRPITWVSIQPTQFTNADQILTAAEAGEIEIEDVIRLPEA